MVLSIEFVVGEAPVIRDSGIKKLCLYGKTTKDWPINKVGMKYLIYGKRANNDMVSFV